MSKFPADALYTIMPVDEPISRRDRFAMAALTGVLASPQTDRGATFEIIARDAAKQADALIAELDKEQSRE